MQSVAALPGPTSRGNMGKVPKQAAEPETGMEVPNEAAETEQAWGDEGQRVARHLSITGTWVYNKHGGARTGS
jgi:hypothetical protein